jgi:hypothetical protein
MPATISVQHLLTSWVTPENIKIKVGTTLILPVVLFGCGTWSLTLREEHRLRAFQNTVLRRYLGIRGRRNRRLEKTA